MIIGISGKMGHGKDAVAQCVEYLTMDWDETGIPKPSFNEYLEIYQGKLFYMPWRTMRFADKLKEITCLLIGCTREQLEDREFKERPLPRESGWWKYESLLSGVIIPFKAVPDPENWKIHRVTPRLILQLLGTECGRNIIHPNIWVNSLFTHYRSDSKWIIPDMRFENELDAVKRRKGVTIRVNRDIIKNKTHLYNEHPSETALDNAKFDYVIDNDGSLDDLLEAVKSILIKEKILCEENQK